MASQAALWFVVLLAGGSGSAWAQLSASYYDESCPQGAAIIRQAILFALRVEPRIGASLCRLTFHDAFVGGMEGSLLLDDTPNFKGEKTAEPNYKSVRGFVVIDDIKNQLEAACPQTFSCVDILVLACSNSIAILGGPNIENVLLGRRDSTTAYFEEANRDIPSPESDITGLIAAFERKGFSPDELTALSGLHTIGLARCTTYRRRIYNDTDIYPAFAKSLQYRCPIVGDDNIPSPIDVQTPVVFDNKYYMDLKQSKGLLHSDQVLQESGITAPLVFQYAQNQQYFFNDVQKAITKMWNINVLTGEQGEVRLNCRKTNSDSF